MVQEQFKVAEVQVSYKPDYNINERPKLSRQIKRFSF